jgi:hypothetical protein
MALCPEDQHLTGVLLTGVLLTGVLLTGVLLTGALLGSGICIAATTAATSTAAAAAAAKDQRRQFHRGGRAEELVGVDKHHPPQLSPLLPPQPLRPLRLVQQHILTTTVDLA